MDIVNARRARRMRKDPGATYREIADQSKTRIPEIRNIRWGSRRGRRHRELREEIREAGGIKQWWKTNPIYRGRD
jgi:hypothetical protein